MNGDIRDAIRIYQMDRENLTRIPVGKHLVLDGDKHIIKPGEIFFYHTDSTIVRWEGDRTPEMMFFRHIYEHIPFRPGWVLHREPNFHDVFAGKNAAIESNASAKNRQLEAENHLGDLHYHMFLTGHHCDSLSKVFSDMDEAEDYMVEDLEMTIEAIEEIMDDKSVSVHNENSNFNPSRDTSNWRLYLVPCECDDPDSHEPEEF